MVFFLKKAKQLKAQIDEFLDIISESALIFEKAIRYYLNNEREEFVQRLQKVTENERKADELRIAIERNLYINTLIPESRGDVLGILENTDNVIDKMKETLVHFSIECPEIKKEFNALFNEVANSSAQAVDMLINGVRAFFNELEAVNNHIHKVHFYEKEADKLAEKLKREIYSTDMDLSRKLHISYFVTNVEKVSDYAKDVSERLAIYTIKRQI
ncbi:MAG: DUF47 family protein [Candidatus Cloacimonetes bacterium]|nr:DUF47 family protein [Candidatus Cloacimonadota bacterium]